MDKKKVVLVLTAILGTIFLVECSIGNGTSLSRPEANVPTDSPSTATASTPGDGRLSTGPAQADNSKTKKSQNPQHLCERIRDIKIVPLKAERGVDKVFDEFLDAGDEVVPCLVATVTDTREMRNPFQHPGFGFPTRIGDVAFFILLYIKDMTADRFLPPELQEEYKTWGIYTYYKYVQEPTNRNLVQNNLRKWYKATYGTDPL